MTNFEKVQTLRTPLSAKRKAGESLTAQESEDLRKYDEYVRWVMQNPVNTAEPTMLVPTDEQLAAVSL